MSDLIPTPYDVLRRIHGRTNRSLAPLLPSSRGGQITEVQTSRIMAGTRNPTTQQVKVLDRELALGGAGPGHGYAVAWVSAGSIVPLMGTDDAWLYPFRPLIEPVATIIGLLSPDICVVPARVRWLCAQMTIRGREGRVHYLPPPTALDEIARSLVQMAEDAVLLSA